MATASIGLALHLLLSPAWVERYVDKCIAAKPAMIVDIKERLRHWTSRPLDSRPPSDALDIVQAEHFARAVQVRKTQLKNLTRLLKEVQKPAVLAHVPLNVFRGPGKRPAIGDVGTIEVGGSPIDCLTSQATGVVVDVIGQESLIVDAYKQTLRLDCPVGSLSAGDVFVFDGLWMCVGEHGRSRSGEVVLRLVRVDDDLPKQFHAGRLAAEKAAKLEAAARAKAEKKKPG